MSDSWPRRRLLAILRGAAEPLDAQQLARVTGQHVTTVRFHLDVLTRDSLVRQFQQPPRGRGRPRIGYKAVQRSIGYQDLAQVLADQLGSDPRRRAEAAMAAGRTWGSKIETPEQPIVNLEQARGVIVTAMSELGFAPERESGPEPDDQAIIRMTGCPLRELARTHSDVVCGVHRGLLHEALDRNGAGNTVHVQLHPFVGPQLCVAHLEAVRDALVPEPAAMPDAAPAGATAGPRLAAAAQSASRLGPQLRAADPQLRHGDAHIAKQPTNQR